MIVNAKTMMHKLTIKCLQCGIPYDMDASDHYVDVLRQTEGWAARCPHCKGGNYIEIEMKGIKTESREERKERMGAPIRDAMVKIEGDEFFEMAGRGRSKDLTEAEEDKIKEWTIALLRAECDCEDCTKVVVEMSSHVNERAVSMALDASSMSMMRCPRCDEPLMKMKGDQRFHLEKCVSCDLVVTHPKKKEDADGCPQGSFRGVK